MFDKFAAAFANAWTWIKGKPPVAAPDVRPDPDDTPAYDHAGLMLQFFEEPGGVFQILPGGKKPHDVSADPKNAPAAPAGYDVWVDVYDGPKGKGFVVNYRRGSFVKRINYGPETWREQDWTSQPLVPVPPAVIP